MLLYANKIFFKRQIKAYDCSYAFGLPKEGKRYHQKANSWFILDNEGNLREGLVRLIVFSSSCWSVDYRIIGHLLRSHWVKFLFYLVSISDSLIPNSSKSCRIVFNPKESVFVSNLFWFSLVIIRHYTNLCRKWFFTNHNRNIKK